MMEDPDFIRQMLLASPHQVSLLKERNPPLAEALESGNAGTHISHFQDISVINIRQRIY